MFALRRHAAVLTVGATLVIAQGRPQGPPLQRQVASQTGTPGSNALESKFQSALAHFNARDYLAAQQELEGLVKSLPNSFEVQELLGLVYSAEGQDEKAAAPLERAARLSPKSGEARNNLAMNLARRGKTQLAEQEFKEVVGLEPGSFDANRNLGSFYLRGGNIKAAVPYLEKAQGLDPGS
jgi:type IV pilus assembly protein PilF